MAQVTTITEKPGRIAVKAFVPAERQNDSRPVAGFFVRRRYHGDVFKLATPDEFSPRWMRFVNPPPKDWEEVITKRFGDDWKRQDDEIEEREEFLPDQFSMGQAASAPKAEIDYASGKIRPVQKRKAQ